MRMSICNRCIRTNKLFHADVIVNVSSSASIKPRPFPEEVVRRFNFPNPNTVERVSVSGQQSGSRRGQRQRPHQVVLKLLDCFTGERITRERTKQEASVPNR